MFRAPWYIAYPVIIIATVGCLYWSANRSIYYPSKYPDGLWVLQAQLNASDVWLQAQPYVRLHGWFIKSPDALPVTLFLHGNAGNITHRLESARQIVAAGSSILLIDYRGYGKSTGSPSERGLYADAEAGYAYLLHSGYTPEHIIIHGESLGTSVAVYLASRHRCAGVVLEAPFSSARDVARIVVPFLGPLLIHSFDSRRIIANVNAPMLFIHGDRDEIVPMRLGRALFQAAHEPKAFWIVKGAGHNDIVDVAGAEYKEKLQAFYASLQ